jgi:hypothetical protein
MDRRRLVHLSLMPPSSSLFSLFSVFLLYFLYFGTSRIRTPERCYSSTMGKRRLGRLSFIPPSSYLFSLSFFCLSPVLPLHHASGLQIQAPFSSGQVPPYLFLSFSFLFSFSFSLVHHTFGLQTGPSDQLRMSFFAFHSWSVFLLFMSVSQ